MRLLQLLLLPLGLVACGDPSDLGGDEIAWAEDDTEVRDDDLSVSMGTAADPSVGQGAECEDEGEPEVSLTLAGGPGQIEVEHRGFVAQCCASWVVSAAFVGEDTIEVSYEDAGTECDCTCEQALSYTLSPVPSGDWIVSVPGIEGEVTVP